MPNSDNDYRRSGLKLRRGRYAFGRPTSGVQNTTFEFRAILLGHGTDIHRALTHPTVESGRFGVVETIAVDIELGLSLSHRQSVERKRETFDADALLLAGPVGPSLAVWASDLAMAHGVPLWAVMPTEVPSAANPRVVWSSNALLLQLAGYQCPRFAQGMKRTIDIVGAIAGLSLFVPFLLILAVLICTESRGMPLIRHTRVARNGRWFGCFKLRTMRNNAEQHLEGDRLMYAKYLSNNYKISEQEDPRIRRLGRFLRRTSIDEVPQFWNVLIGDMSLLGPRPLVPEKLEHYPGTRKRLLLTMRPGLTGAWAVSGRHCFS